MSLIFLWLETVELAVERVKTRVLLGGHDIPEETIRRRYERGLKNLFGLYIPISNAWSVRDTSDMRSIEIARYTETGGEIVFDTERWKTIKM